MGIFSKIDDLCLKGEYRSVLKYLEKGKDVNKRTRADGKYHRTPLHASVLGGALSLVELLLQRGAQVNATDDFGQTPLHYAARVATADIIELLLACGADHTLRDKKGNLPIHMTILGHKIANQERLLQHAIDHPLDVCYFEGGTWHPYDQSNATAVSLELGEGSAYCALVTASGTTYIVDFRLQMQINASSLFAKSICWRVPPNGVWHYPQRPFQGLHAGSQDPAYLRPYAPLLRELRSQGLVDFPPSAPIDTSAPNLNSSTESESTSLFSPTSTLRANQSTSFIDAESPRSGGSLLNPRREGKAHFLSPRPAVFKALLSGSEEYNEIVARFVSGMEKPPRRSHGTPGNSFDALENLRPVTVTKVYEVRAPRERVEAFERAMADRAAARGTANERLAWHGAPFDSLESIVLQGFRVHPQGRNGRLYGQGVYFAPERRAYTSAEFAVPDEHGEKHMLLCRLVAGAMEVVPFESTQVRASSPRFDTGTDNAEEPTRFVVWEDDVREHVLPTHVVSFRYC